jgi:hypothetical protein
MRSNSRRFVRLRRHFALDQNKSPPALQLGLCEFELRISLGKSDHEWFLIHGNDRCVAKSVPGIPVMTDFFGEDKRGW